jgi:hypothetical protein
MGLELPGPGKSTFQQTFSEGDQVDGKPFSVLVPSPRGPRQPGQFSARVERAHPRRTIAQQMINLMRLFSPRRTWPLARLFAEKEEAVKKPVGSTDGPL